MSAPVDTPGKTVTMTPVRELVPVRSCLVRQVTGNSVPVKATLAMTKSETVLAAVVGLLETSFIKYAIASTLEGRGREG